MSDVKNYKQLMKHFENAKSWISPGLAILAISSCFENLGPYFEKIATFNKSI